MSLLSPNSGTRGKGKAVSNTPRLRKDFDELAARLNLGPETVDTAWGMWERSSQYLCKEDLGDLAPWFACIIYCAVRPELLAGQDEQLTKEELAKSLFSMSGLLQAINMSPLLFFARLEDFAKRTLLDGPWGQPPPTLNKPSSQQKKGITVREHAANVLQTIEITAVLQKKFMRIIDDVFPPAKHLGRKDKPSAHARHERELEKWRRKIKEFTWTLFLYAKSYHASVASELVQAFCLLLCSINFAYQNAREHNRLRNNDYEPTNGEADSNATLKTLCKRHANSKGTEKDKDAINLMADCSVVNERIWKPFLVKCSTTAVSRSEVLSLADDGVLLGAFFYTKDTDNRRAKFQYAPRDPKIPLDHNLQSINNAYDALILHQTAIDERSVFSTEPEISGALALTRLKSPHIHHLQQNFSPGKTRSPVSRALNSILVLQNLVGPYSGEDNIPRTFMKFLERMQPDAGKRWKLVEIFGSRIQNIQKLFSEALQRNRSTDDPFFTDDRFNLAVAFYFKAFESVVQFEVKAPQNIFLGLSKNKSFNDSLLACSIQIILFAYQADRTRFRFPWVLQSLSLCPFEFQKIIEVLVRSETGLSTAVIRHLSRCESLIMSELAWTKGSTLLPTMLTQQKLIEKGGKLAGPLVIFFRKVFYLARARLEDLCGKLRIPKDDVIMMSTCLRRAIEVHHQQLLADRHLDQLMLSSIHAVWVVKKRSRALAFADIIRHYRTQPQADSSTCFDILLNGNKRGDIIAFYNNIFVPVMEPFIRTLVSDSTNQDITARPLPDYKNTRVHSPRKLTRTSRVTVSPISHSKRHDVGPSPLSKTRTLHVNKPQSPQRATFNVAYAFHRSPKKDLDAINAHVRGDRHEYDSDDSNNDSHDEDDRSGTLATSSSARSSLSATSSNSSSSGKRKAPDSPGKQPGSKRRTLQSSDARAPGSPLKQAYTASPSRTLKSGKTSSKMARARLDLGTDKQPPNYAHTLPPPPQSGGSGRKSPQVLSFVGDDPGVTPLGSK
eukprot:m.85760 g.85760  ORF g.85760 m.85760 type:complete len:1008 (+) comp13022_c0_seq6:412-3435(+)